MRALRTAIKTIRIKLWYNLSGIRLLGSDSLSFGLPACHSRVQNQKPLQERPHDEQVVVLRLVRALLLVLDPPP